jgi:hypothetical protein
MAEWEVGGALGRCIWSVIIFSTVFCCTSGTEVSDPSQMIRFASSSRLRLFSWS